MNTSRIGTHDSLYERGRSSLDAAIPFTIRGSVRLRSVVLAYLPLAIGAVLSFLIFCYWPVGVPLAVLYVMLGSALLTFMLHIRLSYVRAMNRMLSLQQKAINEVTPALALCGVIASPSQTIALIERQEVAIDPNTNLYGANNMRLIRQSDGMDAIQFEFLT